ncbi:MAG: hypothetical protein OEU26_10615 [Candidatus Tectomicrobia bacterium]|nr:hypothetical protein [Candidatus Tectomicrobia bacterium]
MRTIIYTLFFLVLLPSLSWAHRTALCDSQQPVLIRIKSKSMVQIKTTEPITGVYPATAQPVDFIAWDKGQPNHIFRIDASKMTGDTDVHVNTTGHQCLLRVRVATGRWDSVVTLTYPPTQLQLQAALPPSLRQSGIRQMWFAMWTRNKADAPSTVKVTPFQVDIPGWTPGLKVRVKWRYVMPGFEGFTQLMTNTTTDSIMVRPSELYDPRRPIHSVSITDTLGTTSWRPDGKLMAGESVLLHVVYRKGGR